ncbi:hypothetical protein HHJ81_06525 [Mobiluncus mulieris]|uniref:hypothetical protein n=1 Tax=Mobiluncus mulieris TaxID=2052 RepID=UPI0014706C2F|nr:hypothetical protein [Mobiluncus mulieris]NMW60743.1 hypothetical protein [Mobiluncus mulieris]
MDAEIDIQLILDKYSEEVARLTRRVVLAEALAEEWRRRAMAVEQPDDLNTPCGAEVTA